MYPSIREITLNKKKEMIKELTNVAISIINEYYDEYESGTITSAEAQALAIEKIRRMSYGRDKKDYFWICDMRPVMIMHPYRHDLEGTYLGNFADPNGVKLFYEAVEEVISNKGSGYLEYTWQWKDDSTKLLPKLSYVKLFNEWGWIVGTGIYINDVEDEIANIRHDALKMTLGVIAIGVIMLAFIIIFILKIERRRRRAMEQLVQNEEKFRNVFHTSNDIVIISTPDGKILDVNKKALETYGFSLADFNGRKTLDFIDPKYHDMIRHRIQSLRTKDAPPLEMEFKLGDKYLLHAEIKSSLMTYKGEIAVLSIIRDITERKLSQNRVMNAVITAEENERSRIAKELHDGLGPFLSTIKLYFQWLSETLEEKKRQVIIDKGNRNIEEAITVLREISNNLNPHVLENYGLKDAVLDFISKFEDNPNLNITFTYEPSTRMPHHVEIALYRVFIELINNTLKHANAKNISIAVFEKEGQTFASYSDNGVGFNLNETMETSCGYGLLNIKNRIKNINGEVEIHSTPGNGIQVHISL